VKVLDSSRFRAIVAVLAVLGLAMLLVAIGAVSTSFHGVSWLFPRSALILLAALSIVATLVVLSQAGSGRGDG
jgi:hypothetical protein